MNEVAERAGVSVATVSRVLNNSGSVQPEYRERVLSAIEQTGYRPNLLARNLRRQSASMIGMIISDVENPHFTQMVRKVEDAAYRRGWRVLLCNTDEKMDKQLSYLEILAAERVSGVILSTTNPTGAEITTLLDLGIPVVAFDRSVADPRADAIVTDNFMGARQVTEHLLRLGHERVGFVGGPVETETGAERLRGYEAAMREVELESRWANGWYRIEDGELAAVRLLDDAPLTALVVANNLMTIGVLQALRTRRLRVPQDVALAAIDDPFWAELIQPPLTTLAQPVREMADCAVEFLFDRISGRREKPRKIVYDFELRVRSSCGANGMNYEEGMQR